MSKTIVRHRKTNAVAKRIVLIDSIPAVVTVYAPSAEYSQAMTWCKRGGAMAGSGVAKISSCTVVADAYRRIGSPE